MIIAAAPFVPPLGAAVAANPQLAGVLAGLIMCVLRIVTKSGVKVK